MIELIAVLVIGGVIAAVALSRPQAPGAFDQAGEYARLVSHLRLAQSRSLKRQPGAWPMTPTATAGQWGLRLDSPTMYHLVFRPAGSAVRQVQPLPGMADGVAADPYRVVLEGLTLAAPAAEILFGPDGSAGAGDIVIQTNYRNVCINQLTGFIQDGACTPSP